MNTNSKLPSANNPTFYLLAGPNGAGKSTLYAAMVDRGQIEASAEFVNADVYESRHLQHIADPIARSEMARDWADKRRAALIASGQSFVSETVFSHHSKLDLIDAALAANYSVVLFVVGVDDPNKLIARVARRVTQGGHSVPVERILARYPRTLENLRLAVQKASMSLVFDNSDIDSAEHKLVALTQRARVVRQVDPLPKWAATVLGQTKSN